MENKVIIKQSFFKSLSLVLGCLLMAGISVYSLLFMDSSFTLKIVGIVGALFFGGGFIFLIIAGAFKPGNILSIEGEGFAYWIPGMEEEFFIPWGEVKDIYVTNVDVDIMTTPLTKTKGAREHMVSILLKDKETLLSKCTGYKKDIMENILDYNDPKIHISLSTANAKAEDVLEIMNNYLTDYRQNNDNVENLSSLKQG